MRWTARPKPKDRDVRVRKVFAFLPTVVQGWGGGNVRVWAEHYYVVECYRKFAYPHITGWAAIAKVVEDLPLSLVLSPYGGSGGTGSGLLPHGVVQ